MAGVKCVRVMVVWLCECDRVIVMGCVIVMYVVMSWRRFWLCVIMMTCGVVWVIVMKGLVRYL